MVRGLDGKLIAEPLVWSARVAQLRANAEAGIKTTNVAVSLLLTSFLALALILSGFYWVFDLQYYFFESDVPTIGYILVALVVLGVLALLGWVIYDISRKVAAKGTKRLARSVWDQLVISDLGVMIADPVYWRIVFERLDDSPMMKWLCPPPPRNFEAHLEWAAINCTLLSMMNKDGVEQSSGRSSVYAWHANAKHSVPCACGLSLACGPFLCGLPSGLVFLWAIFAITAVQHAAKSRMIAICDFLLEDYSAWYLQGWHEPYPEARVLRQIARIPPPGPLSG